MQLGKFCLLCLIFFTLQGLTAQARKDFYVSLQPVPGNEKVLLLFCSVEEHAAKKNSSSVFTTRLPTLPLRLGKWEESIFVLPNTNSPMQTVHLKDGVTFSFPLAGISRKVHVIRDPEYPEEFILSLYWHEGSAEKNGMVKTFRIWSIVKLKPGRPVLIGSLEGSK